MAQLGAGTGRLYVALYFPALAVDYWLRASEQTGPLALYSGQTLVASSVAARLAGVTEGMSLTSALALLPAICLRAYEPDQGVQLLQSLAQWAYSFTPYVEVEEPHFLHLEVAGSLRLFHGQGALLERLCAELSAWRCEVFIGLGPTRIGAKLLAKTQALEAQPSLAEQQLALAGGRLGQVLAALPVSRLDLPAATLKRLSRSGFRQVGQLMALPLSSLGQRFGKDSVCYLQQLCGQNEKPISALALAPAFNHSVGFIYGLTDAAHLQQPMQLLLLQLQQFLRQRQLMTRRICWRFCHEDKSLSELAVAVQAAHSDTDEFYQLTCLKMEHLKWSSAIELVGLEALDLSAAEPVAQGLFRDMRDQGDNMARLINRFYQRFSRQQFFNYALQAEHLPDKQQCAQQACVAKKSSRTFIAEPAQLASVELRADDNSYCPWLMNPAQVLLVRQEKLFWYERGQALELQLLNRASRFDSHWWQQRERRDYYIAKAQMNYYSVYFCHQRQQWFMAGVYVC